MSQSVLVNAVIAEGVGLSTAYTPTYAVDVFAIFDQQGNQLFPLARPQSATITETAKVMRHPVESGSTIVDHRVIEPTKISIPFIIDPSDYVNTFAQIHQLWLGNDVVSIQTKVGLYTNMMLASIPHKEDSQHFDTVTLTLNFEKVIFVTASVSQLPDAPHQTGTKQAKAVTAGSAEAAKAEAAPHNSILYNLAN